MNQNRRSFLKTSSAAAMAGVFFPAAATTAGVFSSPAKAGFRLVIMATNWGFNGSVDAFCAAAKKEGYDGIEVWWPAEAAQQKELFSALKKHDLQVGFLCGGYQPDFKEHFETFKRAINAAATNSLQQPVYINCHSGRDHFSYEENKAFIDATTALSAQTGITICHETHRSRMLFAAHVARQFIEKNPSLKLTLDISHWCNVHESMLGDQKETVARALERTAHIHARIGHPEGPQVNDPRAPEWEAVVKQHFDWWDVVAERKRKQGEIMTVLTEFGPPAYMPVLPYTQQPVADQWAINVHMMKILRNRYQ
ncbi:sugar phosphate isomerase/epimerase family protein [Niabella drilacis]|uniref:Sugar phosphate isomerase/epimerase n=1 Tax=Niabella drilacis (strain DSM 25811 / CCM 8410 / CCUG 62505 / LMG 26954 / E90) TaxID=1285928 RepID=A0A1G7B8T3_NIADE|nr:TIM barrel protein [Niabella drilacis]SDE23250.1 Sugar phosphate isomerase/epimerase [Niabella drilacis]